jgi:hypothetical protein
MKPLKDWLPPGFVCESSFNLANVLKGRLIIPIPAKPSANTAPNVSCPIGRIAGKGCSLVKVGSPSIVANTNETIHIFGAERCVYTAHRPRAFIIDIFNLENTVALITLGSIPRTRIATARWAEALIVRRVA